MAITSYFNKYYDDINIPDVNGLTPEDKNYLRILFQPARAVQSRELNQIQSLLQIQIDRLGQSLFVPNSPIKSGKCTLDVELKYIDVLIPITQHDEFVGAWLEEENDWPGNDAYENKLTLTQNASTTLAIILKSEKLVSTDPAFVKYRLFIKYKSKDIDDNGENIDSFTVTNGLSINLNFLPSDTTFVLTPVILNDPDNELEEIEQEITGRAIGASIEPGIFYTRGTAVISTNQFATFALERQFITDPETGLTSFTAPEFFNGDAIFIVSENIISSYEDRSLEDNAAGSTNYAAPGADRYQINLSLALVDDYDDQSTNPDYIDAVRILNIRDSSVVLEHDGNDNLQVIERILAIRTYEESGDYCLSPFKLHKSEVWNDGSGNNGKYNNILDLKDAINPYLIANNIDPSEYTDQDYIDQSQNWYIATVDPSTAYVKGHRVKLDQPNTLLGRKARDSYVDLDSKSELQKVNLSANLGNYITVTYEGGLPNIDSSELEYLLKYNQELQRSPGSYRKQTIGTCKIQTVESYNDTLRLYIHVIKMFNNRKFQSVEFIEVDALITGDDPDEQHYGAFKGTLVNPGELNDTWGEGSIIPLPFSAVKHVENINVSEKKSFVKNYDYNADIANFTLNEGVFDASPGNLEVLFHPGGISAGYYPITDYNLNISTSQDITFEFSDSLTNGQLNDYISDYLTSLIPIPEDPGPGLLVPVTSGTDIIFEARVRGEGTWEITTPKIKGSTTLDIKQTQADYDLNGSPGIQGLPKEGEYISFVEGAFGDVSHTTLYKIVNANLNRNVGDNIPADGTIEIERLIPQTTGLLEDISDTYNILSIESPAKDIQVRFGASEEDTIIWLEPIPGAIDFTLPVPGDRIEFSGAASGYVYDIISVNPVQNTIQIALVSPTRNIEGEQTIGIFSGKEPEPGNRPIFSTPLDTQLSLFKLGDNYVIGNTDIDIVRDETVWPHNPYDPSAETQLPGGSILQGDRFIMIADGEIAGIEFKKFDVITAAVDNPDRDNFFIIVEGDIAQLQWYRGYSEVIGDSPTSYVWEKVFSGQLITFSDPQNTSTETYTISSVIRTLTENGNTSAIFNGYKVRLENNIESNLGLEEEVEINQSITFLSQAGDNYELPVGDPSVIRNPYEWYIYEPAGYDVRASELVIKSNETIESLINLPLVGQHIILPVTQQQLDDLGVTEIPYYKITAVQQTTSETGESVIIINIDNAEWYANNTPEPQTETYDYAADLALGTSSLLFNSKVRIMATVQNTLGISSLRGKKTLVTQDISLPSNLIPDLGEEFELPNVYHLMSINPPGGNNDKPVEFEIVEGGNGQTPTQYKNARVRSLKQFSTSPGVINVTHWVFTDGDYYTANSYYYENGDPVVLDDIPDWKGESLGDVLDFRQRLGSENRIALDPYSPITCEIDYYLPRNDVLTVNTDREFEIKEGTPAENPEFPDVSDKEMVLYNIEQDPYVYNLDNIKFTRIDNRRYTMRDIGELDKRITTLEYYTTLSLLEKGANDESIYDKSGERFKNGFVVDGFRGHDVGNPSNPDYKCSVRREKGRLYPHHEGYSVPLTIDNVSQISGNAQFPKTGVNKNTITLQYKTVPYIIQPYATQYISVQPHEVVSVPGKLELNPTFDTWVDTENRPATTIDPLKGINDAIKNIAELTGVTGTDWDEWQFTGKQDTKTGSGTRTWTSSSTKKSFNRSSRTMTETKKKTTYRSEFSTYERENFFERTGIQTGVWEGDEVRESLGRYVSNVEIRPFMRSRLILFQASGVLPNTRFYPFFDEISVADFCWNFDSTVIVDPQSTIFPFVPGFSDWTILEEKMNENFFDGMDETTLLDCLDFWYGSGPNVKQLKSNDQGIVRGALVLPNSNNLRFAGGEKTFFLTNSIRNNKDEEESTAKARYISSGLKQTTDEKILSTRPVEVGQRQVFDTKSTFENFTVTDSTVKIAESKSTRTYPYDPVAQSFKVDEATGIFISDVDIYFAAKPGFKNSPPVEIYLVTMQSGYPSTNIFPGSTVIKQTDEVNISDDGSVSTNFEFEDPLYLMPGEEYTIVVFSPSTRYKVWISEIGGESRDTITGRLVKHQPATGVFFTSSNKSTWKAEPNKDLKITINRASFDTNDAIVTAQPKIGSGIDEIIVNNPGNDYDLATLVTIDPPNSAKNFNRYILNDSAFSAAGAIAAVDPNTGKIERIAVTKKGLGYSSPPNVTISGGDGTATATAKLQQVDISAFGLNQDSILVDYTNIINKVTLGPADIAETYTVVAKSPWQKLKQNGHYINADVQNSSGLSMTLQSSDERVSPVIDTTTLAINTRAYHITNQVPTTSKYFTKTITLKNPADQIDGYLAINRPAAVANIQADIKIFDADGNVITWLSDLEDPLLTMTVTPDPSQITDFNLDEIIDHTLVVTNNSNKVITGIKVIFDRSVNILTPGTTVADGEIVLQPGASTSVLEFQYTVTAEDVIEGNLEHTSWIRLESDLSNVEIDNSDPNQLVTLVKSGTVNEWWNVPAIEPTKIPIVGDLDDYRDVRYQRNFENDGVQFNSFIVRIALLSENIVQVPTLNSFRFIAST